MQQTYPVSPPFLDEPSRQSSWGHLGIIWGPSGVHWGIDWGSSGGHLGVVWGSSGGPFWSRLEVGAAARSVGAAAVGSDSRLHSCQTYQGLKGPISKGLSCCTAMTQRFKLPASSVLFRILCREREREGEIQEDLSAACSLCVSSHVTHGVLVLRTLRPSPV